MQLQYDTPIVGQNREVPDWMVVPESLPKTWEYMSNENRAAYGTAQRDSMFGQLINSYVMGGKFTIDNVEEMMDLAWEIATKYGRKVGATMALRNL